MTGFYHDGNRRLQVNGRQEHEDECLQTARDETEEHHRQRNDERNNAAENDDHIAIDVSLDGGVAEDHRDFTRGVCRLERVALPDPKDRAQMVRDILRSLGQPLAQAASA